jgi:hypothetical protein
VARRSPYRIMVLIAMTSFGRWRYEQGERIKVGALCRCIRFMAQSSKSNALRVRKVSDAIRSGAGNCPPAVQDFRAMPTASDRFMEARKSFRKILTDGITSYFMNTSTTTTEPGWGPATKRGGQAYRS